METQTETKSLLKSFEAYRLEASEFRKVMLAWMKQQEKTPSSTSGAASGIELHTPPPATPTGRNFMNFSGVFGEASPVISTAAVITKLEELISKSEARSSLFAKLEPSPKSPLIDQALSESFFKSGGGIESKTQQTIITNNSSPGAAKKITLTEFLANEDEEKHRSFSSDISHSQFRVKLDSGYNLGCFEGNKGPVSFQVDSGYNLGCFEGNKGPVSFQLNSGYNLGCFERNTGPISFQPNIQFQFQPSTVGCFEGIKGPISLKLNVKQKMGVGLIFSNLDLCKKGKAPFDRGKDSLSHCPLNGSRLTFSVTWNLWIVHGQPRPPEDAIEEAFT